MLGSDLLVRRMSDLERCPECGAVWRDGESCEAHFHQMLFWEAENPANGEVHHLAVLCYHLQHPHLYSPETLVMARKMLADFVVGGVTPQEMRRRNKDKVASNKRDWKITGDKISGAYDRPIQWTMTVADVIADGSEHYRESVRAWARSMHEALAAVYPSTL